MNLRVPLKAWNFLTDSEILKKVPAEWRYLLSQSVSQSVTERHIKVLPISILLLADNRDHWGLTAQYSGFIAVFKMDVSPCGHEVGNIIVLSCSNTAICWCSIL